MNIKHEGARARGHILAHYVCELHAWLQLPFVHSCIHFSSIYLQKLTETITDKSDTGSDIAYADECFK